jgi:hypothetical protein
MRLIATGVLVAVLGVPVLGQAQVHVVSPEELRQDVRSAAAKRQENAAKLRTFLSSEMARDAIGKAKLDAGRIDRAIASLSDAEVARLAAKSDQIRNDFAAGRLTNTQITYIILGAILIIVIAILAS